jgi:hypothetical protein
MKQQGQIAVVFALVLIVVLAVAFMGIAGSMVGMKTGADAIGETMGDAIDNATYDQEFENLVWQAQNAVAAHVGAQRALQPNQHAIAEHGNEAWAAVDCYNRNGTMHVMQTLDDGIHLLCNDNGKIHDVIVKQRGNTKEFDMKTAFTPKRGVLRDVLDWIRRKPGASKFTMPENSVIYVDGAFLP